jgi:hypothetical protein
MALLDSALDFAKNGRRADAGDRAFDAYIAFEPLETPARAKQPGLVASMERHFAEFKGAVRKSDMNAAQGARDAIALDLPRVVELTRTTSGGWAAFSSVAADNRARRIRGDPGGRSSVAF